MRFKAPTFEIPADDPFKFDVLSRKESADIPTEFVDSLTESFVLAIDSPWGTGKTVFLKMWIQTLRNQGRYCLYFNAWENDFSDSPLVSLIGEIGDSIENLDIPGKKKDFANKAFEKTKKLGATLVKAALPAAVKMATAGMLDLNEALETTIADLAEKLAQEEIEKYQADKNTIQHFRSSLSNLVAALRKIDAKAAQKPIVFVIDELDRCRPDYAVQLLEKVKHLFSVEGLVFVLSIDRNQLGECVKSLYGAGMNADGYLRRFIDLEYRLPAPEKGKFTKALFEKYGLNQAFDSKPFQLHGEGEALLNALTDLFEIFDFGLRIQEQCFTQISVVMRMTPLDGYLYSHMLALLICLRVANRQLYFTLVDGLASHDEVLNYLRSLPGGTELVDSRLGAILEADLVINIRDWHVREEILKKYEALSKPDNQDEKSRTRAQSVRMYISHLSPGGLDNARTIDFISRKIEVARRFIPAPSEA